MSTFKLSTNWPVKNHADTNHASWVGCPQRKTLASCLYACCSLLCVVGPSFKLFCFDVQEQVVNNRTLVLCCFVLIATHCGMESMYCDQYNVNCVFPTDKIKHCDKVPEIHNVVALHQEKRCVLFAALTGP